MRKIVFSLVAVFAMVGCGDFVGDTTDSHDIADSHNLTLVNTTAGGIERNVTTKGEVGTAKTLEVPTFNGNSQGKLVVLCESDIVYYIMAYDCLRQDTRVSVTVKGGQHTIDEKNGKDGEVFYTTGHVERTGDVTITGRTFTGGKNLPKTWVETCKGD